MAGMLVYSDVAALAAELVGAGKGSDVSVLALDAKAAESLATCGASTLLVADIGGSIPEACAESIAKLIDERGYDLFVVGATERGRSLAAQVAGFLHCGMGSDVLTCERDGDGIALTRVTYGGKVVSSERIEGRAVVTMGRGRFEATDAPVGQTESIELAGDSRISVTAREEIVHEGVDLESAEYVIDVGMGVSEESGLAMAQDLADALGGAVGCSRGIADERRWLPQENYIGISGKQLASKFVLMMGVSGQVQHTSGLRDVKVVAGINTDEKAPMAAASDYYIVGDYRDYVPLIAKTIRKR